MFADGHDVLTAPCNGRSALTKSKARTAFDKSVMNYKLPLIPLESYRGVLDSQRRINLFNHLKLKLPTAPT